MGIICHFGRKEIDNGHYDLVCAFPQTLPIRVAAHFW